MKKFLVVLVACAMIFAFASTALAAEQIPEFSDLSDQSQAVVTAVEKLAILGVLEGDAGLDGPYRPTENVTRGEFAKIVCYLAAVQKNATSLQSVQSKFPDVSTQEWFNGWVNGATSAGFFMGDDHGNFRPYDNVTMAEVATVVLRIVGYDEHLPGDWPANYGNKAASVGVLDDVEFSAYAPATRADVAVLCEAVLDLNMVVYVGGSDISAWLIGQGEADKDGYAEQSYISNEHTGEVRFIDILEKSFDAFGYDVQMAFSTTFDEVTGWVMEDFADNDYSLVVEGMFDPDNNGDMINYNDDEEIGALYYITKGFDFVDLAGMQAEIIVMDDKVVFVDPVSTYVLADKIYAESNGRINVDGKSARLSDTAAVTDAAYGNGHIYSIMDDIARNSGDEDYITFHDFDLDLITASSSDDTFAGKVYYDEDGRVYAVKNYYEFRNEAFGIFEELDGSTIRYKNAGATIDWDTEEDYLIYRDGEKIAIEDLDANDLIYDLGDGVGVDFYLAAAPVSGDMTTQNRVKSGGLVKISGVEYPGDPGFQFSEDAGDTFVRFHLDQDDIAKESFGDVEYAKAYYFHNVAYVASMNGATKLYGVVDSMGSTIKWDNTQTATPNYKSIAITNGEGKVVTYNLTSKLSTDMNDLFENGVTASLSYVDTTLEFGSYHAAGEPIQEGDLVQLVLDSNDNVKRIEKYAPMNPDWYLTNGNGIDEVEVTVNKARSRISYTDATGAKYQFMNSDVVIFQVSVDGSDFDEVSVVSLDTLMSSDFDVAQLVPFDKNSAGNLRCFYYIGETSSRSFGVLTEVVREPAYADYGLAFDGAAYVNGDTDTTGVTPNTWRRHFVMYKGGANVTVTDSLVSNAGYTVGADHVYNNVKLVDTDYDVFRGTTTGYDNHFLNVTVNTTATGTSNLSSFYNQASVDADISSITYIYDFDASKVLKTSDLNKAENIGRDVVVIVDETSQALYVLYLAKTVAPVSTAITSGSANVVVDNTAHTLTIPFAATPMTVNTLMGHLSVVSPATLVINLANGNAAAGTATVDTGMVAVVTRGNNVVPYTITVTPGSTVTTLAYSDTDLVKAHPTASGKVAVATDGVTDPKVADVKAELDTTNGLGTVEIVDSLGAVVTNQATTDIATGMKVRVTPESGSAVTYDIEVLSNVAATLSTGSNGGFTYTVSGTVVTVSGGLLADIGTYTTLTAAVTGTYQVFNNTTEITTGSLTDAMTIVVTAAYGNTVTYSIVNGN